MWLSDRRKVLIFLTALPLGACGFTPLYAPGGTLRELRDRIRVADPHTRNDFTLKSELESRLGMGGDFDLDYRIELDESDAGITPDQVITRRQIDGTVRFVLTDRATGAVLMDREVEASTSYGTTSTTASTDFARTAALDRLMVIIADRIVAQLATLTVVPA